jgi:hypothetical protein
VAGDASGAGRTDRLGTETRDLRRAMVHMALSVYPRSFRTRFDGSSRSPRITQSEGRAEGTASLHYWLMFPQTTVSGAKVPFAPNSVLPQTTV